MQSNKKNFSFIPLWILIIVCAICIVASLFISISLSDSLDENNFKIDGLSIAKYDSSKDSFKITSLNRNNIPKELRSEFTKNFLKEYVVNRYTVSGNDENLQQNIGYKSPKTLNGGLMLKLPSIKSFSNGEIIGTNAYDDFLKNDLPEIQELLKSNVTRSVKILTSPRKIDDWWTLNVEFIYRNPTTYSLDIAKKEKYEIKLNIENKGIRNTENLAKNYPAGSFLEIYVIDIQKIKL